MLALNPAKKMTKYEAIREYFQANGGKYLSNGALLYLKLDDKEFFEELAKDAAKELGVTLE